MTANACAEMRTAPTVQTMFIEPTDESGRHLVERGMSGPLVMLNLLRFKEVADYSAYPELAPQEPISGSEAYDRYAKLTTPFLVSAGGSLEFVGQGGFNLIGPPDERWDLVLLVRYPDLDAFMSMTGSQGYLDGFGHRTAALEDSRLLPIVESHSP